MTRMDTPDSIRAVVNLWPTRSALVADIRALTDRVPVTVAQVHKWAAFERIPAKYQHLVLKAARQRGFPVTADLLVALHAADRSVA